MDVSGEANVIAEYDLIEFRIQPTLDLGAEGFVDEQGDVLVEALFAAASATTSSAALQWFYAVADWRAESMWAVKVAEVVGPDDVFDLDGRQRRRVARFGTEDPDCFISVDSIEVAKNLLGHHREC
jgi:hypothetical protein